MPLSRFAITLPRAADAFLSAADALRFIRDSGGDLPWRTIEDAQQKIAAAKVTGLAAYQDAQIRPAAAQQFLADIGGPATLAEFNTLLGQLNTAMNAWHTGLSSLLSIMDGTEFMAVVQRGTGTGATHHFERVGFLTQARADVLRSSTQLANLIAAFEAVGA